jgi:poly-gamma-glutamate synthesis protein (capsule biosynthesis protein)
VNLAVNRIIKVLILAALGGVLVFLTIHFEIFKERVALIYKAPLSFAEKNPQSFISASSSIKILFVGDMMFDRYIRTQMKNYGSEHIFGKIQDFLNNYDVVVGNLEGPITNFSSVSEKSAIGSSANFIFTFPENIAKILYEHNIKILNIGNNHILNFGEKGLKQTKEFLKNAGISFFGDPEDDDKTLSIKLDDINITFISYNQFIGETKNVQQNVLSDIKKAQKNGMKVVVYAHWGQEYQDSPSEEIKNLAHKFIDAGADVVIGSHPHVIQFNENYKGKMIYYSLGNFVFDQYFSKKTKKGLALEMEIDLQSKNIKYKEFIIKMNPDGSTSL